MKLYEDVDLEVGPDFAQLVTETAMQYQKRLYYGGLTVKLFINVQYILSQVVCHKVSAKKTTKFYLQNSHFLVI